VALLKRLLCVFFILFPLLSFADLRIVSLAPNVTEILFKIGVGENVVGVTDRCDYPPEVDKLPEVGNYFRPSLEKILMLNPTHVIGMREGYTKQLKEKLDEYGITNRFYQVNDYEDIITMITDIGSFLDKPVDELTENIRSVFANNHFDEMKAAIFLINTKPAYAVGGGNFVDDIMKCAGLKNLFGDGIKGFPQVNYEKIFELEPEYIIVAKRHGSANDTSFLRKKIKQFDRDIIIVEIEPNLFLRPSYRITDACKILRKQLNR